MVCQCIFNRLRKQATNWYTNVLKTINLAIIKLYDYGRLAQLDRALASEAKGRWFESSIARQTRNPLL